MFQFKGKTHPKNCKSVEMKSIYALLQRLKYKIYNFYVFFNVAIPNGMDLKCFV